MTEQLKPPAGGETITIANGKLDVPANPIVPFIEGDGTGPDIWRASVRVLDAAVSTTGAASNATLGAKWTYQDGQTVNDSSQTIAPTGPAVTTFHISKPDGWPAGNYKVEISLDGNAVSSKDFSVK